MGKNRTISIELKGKTLWDWATFGPVWSWALRAAIAFIVSGVSLKSGFAQRSVLGVGVLCALPKIFKKIKSSKFSIYVLKLGVENR